MPSTPWLRKFSTTLICSSRSSSFTRALPDHLDVGFARRFHRAGVHRLPELVSRAFRDDGDAFARGGPPGAAAFVAGFSVQAVRREARRTWRRAEAPEVGHEEGNLKGCQAIGERLGQSRCIGV